MAFVMISKLIFFFLFFLKLLGAYGEVRKAIHKQTQLVRAVKIISKSNTPKQE
jgi:hypothetical protein